MLVPITNIVSEANGSPHPREREPQDPNTERPPGDWQGPVEDPDPVLEPLRDPVIDVPPEESNDDDVEGGIVV